MPSTHLDSHPLSVATDRAAEHALPLPGGPWMLWRTAALRGAGLPASLVETLAMPRAAVLADAYVERDEDVARARQNAVRTIGAASAAADLPTRRKLRALKAKIARDHVPHDRTLPVVSAFADAIDRRAQAHAAFRTAFDADTAALDESLQRLLQDERFTEAVMWQNRLALTVARRRVGERVGPGPDRRRAAEFVAMVAQRYAVKNDSIGFFGPVGWATLVDAPLHVSCMPGPSLLKRRRVYFEWWTIDALAARLNTNPALRPWLAPRLRLGVSLGADVVFVSLTGPVPATRDELALLRLCDGRRSAKDIASMLVGAAPDRWSTEDVFAALARLVDREILQWRLDVGNHLHPEQELERRLLDIGDPDVREASLAPLRELLECRSRVSLAAGKPARLEPALEHLDETFHRITGQAPTRRPGELYAARTLVYEDCIRGCDVALGADLLARLGPPLSIVLQAARSASADWRSIFSEHLRKCHQQLRERLGTDVIDAHTFVRHAVETAKGPDGKAPRGGLLPAERVAVRERHQQRWQMLMDDYAALSCEPNAIERVAARAASLFAADDCGSFGGYFSPDVLVSAAGPDAVRRGEYRLVLGEVHSGNTLLQSALMAQHPDPDSLIAGLTRDTDGRDVVFFQYPRTAMPSRACFGVAPGFWRYQHGDDPPALQNCRPLPAGLVVAFDDGKRVRMRARDGRIEFDAYEAFAHFVQHDINALINGRFPDAPHTPRMTIGDLTIARERWQFGRGDLPFLEESDRANRFLQIRGWARRHSLQRRVFCRFSNEQKPCYVDFDSLIYTETFARMCQRLDDAGVVSISEMVPDLDDLWLVDAEGTRYTSELRFVACLGQVS